MLLATRVCVSVVLFLFNKYGQRYGLWCRGGLVSHGWPSRYISHDATVSCQKLAVVSGACHVDVVFITLHYSCS